MPLATGRTKKETQFQSFEAFPLALRASHTIWITKTGKFKFDHDSTLIDRIEIGQLRKSLFSVWSRWSGNSSHSWRGKKKEKKVFSDFNDFRTHNFFYVLCVVHESNVERGLRRKLIILWSWSWANAEFGGKKNSLGSSSRHPRVPYNLRDIIINCWFALLTFLNRFLRYLRSSCVVVAAVLIGTSSMLWFFASVSPYARCCKVDKMCPEVVKELLCCSSQWELIH